MLDRVVAIASWLIVVALLWSAVAIWINPLGAGPVTQLVGVFGAQLFYTTVYAVEAIVLAWAKLSGRMRIRKIALLAIFFTGVFTFGLTISIIGFSVAMLDNMALFILAGACWLYWKIKTEYMSRQEMQDFFVQ